MDRVPGRHQKDVTRFFDGYAEEFHGIYGRQHASTLGGFIDRLTRRGMFARFQEVIRQCESLSMKSLLDVGCGPGIHGALLAKELDMTIHGLDVAQRMIDIANANASENGVSDKCDYMVVDFMDFTGGCDYDVSLALGVVEYIEDPAPFVRKMISHAKRRVMFSLPVKWHLLTPQRMIRYKIRKCPLMFYDRKDISLLMNRCRVNCYDVKRMNRDFLIIVSSEKE